MGGMADLWGQTAGVLLLIFLSELPLVNSDILLPATLQSIRSNLPADYHSSLQSLSDKLLLSSRLAESGPHHDVLRKVAYNLSDPEQLLRQALSNSNITNECASAITFIVNRPLSDKRKLQYFDSFGKPGDGILQGHIFFRGMYDECLAVNMTTETEDITTKYCTLKFPILDFEETDLKIVLELKVGICAPNQCTTEDLTTIFGSVLPIKGLTTFCQDQSKNMPTGTKAALSSVLMIIGLCFIATVYEGVKQLRRKWACNGLHGNECVVTPVFSQQGRQICVYPHHLSKSHSRVEKAILSFSLYTNTKRLLNTEQSSEAIRCIHGLKFISLTWVILGHTLLFYTSLISDNPTYILDLMSEFAAQALINATLSVDTFFVIGGILAAVTLLKLYRRKNVQMKEFFKSVPMMYIHRYLRLTPAYALMLLIYSTVMWYMWDGPYWPHNEYRTIQAECTYNWWINLLYLNNLIRTTDQCAPYSWYLCNDFQFFLIAPFLVYVYHRSASVGALVIIFFSLGSCVSASFTAYVQKYIFTLNPAAKVNFTGQNIMFGEPLNQFITPWARFQSYGVGLLAGCILVNLNQRKLKIPMLLNLAGWGLSLALCMSVIYGPYAANMGYHVVNIGESVVYTGFARIAWGIGIAYIIISCAQGQAGWIGEFLSWSGFVPLSRLSYCAYLINLPLVTIMTLGARSGTYYTHPHFAADVVMWITVTFLMAYPFSMLFEQPFVNLENTFLVPVTRKGKSEQGDANTTQNSYTKLSHDSTAKYRKERSAIYSDRI